MMENIEDYFGTCVAYWVSIGVNEGVATVRALWWDCAEVWNADKSWTPEKIEFFHKWRPSYEPYSAIPEEESVREGNA